MTGKRSYYSSSSFKMAALFTILLGASALLLGSYLYDFSRQIFIQETEAAIDIEIEHILVSFENKSQDELLNYIKKRSEKYSNPVYYYQDRLDKRLAGNIKKLPTTVTPISEGIIQFSLEVSGKPKKFGAKIHTFDDGSRLLIGRDINNIIQRYERLQFFSILILLFMMSVVLVSFFISMFVVSRINIIGQTAQNIMATGDLSERISIDSNWDDLSNLAQSLNAMLARIEELMIGIRDVSDNIAHDLRTPLARLRTQLESALKKPLTEEEIDGLLKETDELLGTFNALLRISQIEKGSQKFEFKQTSLKTILADVIELYDPLAEEKAIIIKHKLRELPTIPTYGHLIFQMIANIIDNALKYSPKESTVLIELAVDDDYQLIRVTDQGIGIKSEEHDKVFDRFYRSDKSRHTEGNGLGLSLVKAALALHKGEITFKDNNPGLVVEIRLKS
ncbi:MAG: HAMP domain-containing histidine kinase [Rhizobiales bacterium]|nr:HAMP domain-containing histidine kinase [Hyphomicrobiales bacterium]